MELAQVVPSPKDVTDAVTAVGGLDRFAILLTMLLAGYAAYTLIKGLPNRIKRWLRGQDLATEAVVDMLAQIGTKVGVDLSKQQRRAQRALDGKPPFDDDESTL